MTGRESEVVDVAGRLMRKPRSSVAPSRPHGRQWRRSVVRTKEDASSDRAPVRQVTAGDRVWCGLAGIPRLDAGDVGGSRRDEHAARVSTESVGTHGLAPRQQVNRVEARSRHRLAVLPPPSLAMLT